MFCLLYEALLIVPYDNGIAYMKTNTRFMVSGLKILSLHFRPKERYLMHLLPDS